MDEYGRLIPAVERFPSSANGQGFKPLADYVHSKGLKFGTHNEGYSRVAWFNDLPVKEHNIQLKILLSRLIPAHG
jgi:alpha-galactosidase